MSIADKLFGRSRSAATPNELSTGMVRIGLTQYNARWSYSRALTSVYSNSTGYACIQTIKNDFSRPPWAVFDEKAPDQQAKGSAAQQLLDVLNRPDAMMSGTAMQQFMALDLEINGRSIWLQLRGKDRWGNKGPLTGLKRLPCENITVLTNYDRDLVGFMYTRDDGSRYPLLPSEVLYIHHPHPQNPWEGYPPAFVAGLPAEVDDRAKRFNYTLLENDAALPGYLTVEGLTPDQFMEYRAIWEAGADPGRTRLLGGDGKTTYTQVGTSSKDMMMDTLLQTSEVDICKAFGLSPLVLNPTDATFANGNQARVNYLLQKIDPMWTMVSDQLTTQLHDDFPGLKVGFDLTNISELSEGEDDLVNRAVLLVTNGIMDADEARVVLGMKPRTSAQKLEMEYAAGELAPPSEEATAAETEDAAKTDEAEANKELTVGTLPYSPQQVTDPVVRELTPSPSLPSQQWKTFSTRLVPYEGQARRKMERFYGKQGQVISQTIRSRRGKSFSKALTNYFNRERWDAELVDDTTSAYQDVIDSFGIWTDHSFDPTNERVTSWITERAEQAAKAVNDQTEAELAKVIEKANVDGATVDDIADAVEAYFATKAIDGAERWATTEITASAATGVLLAKAQTATKPDSQASEALALSLEAIDEGIDKHQAKITAAVTKVAKKQKKAVLASLNAVAEEDQPNLSVEDIFASDHWETITSDTLGKPIAASWVDGARKMAVATGVAYSTISDEVVRQSSDRVSFVAKSVTSTTAKRIDSALKRTQGADAQTRIGQVTNVFAALVGEGEESIDPEEEDSALTGWRADLIGVTEASFGFLRGLGIAAFSVDNATIYWRAYPGCCGPCGDLNGTEITDFSPLHPSCRCSPVVITNSGDEIEVD